jgi:predicted tellurium resistance membrane protein TerC
MVGFSLFFEGLEPVHGSHIDKGYIYFAMAFSFGVELMNLWMKRREKARKPIELREPVLPAARTDTSPTPYDDSAH